MYLKKLIIVNYKSCQYVEVNPYKDAPTVLIGVNDCGKSTILKAIGLLLDPKAVYHYQDEGSMKNDLSHNRMPVEALSQKLESLGLPMLPYSHNTTDQTFVLGLLTLENEDIQVMSDTECSPHLGWTIDGQEQGEKSIWLARSFHVSKQKDEYFLLTPDTLEGDAFFGMLQKDLKIAQGEYNISDELVKNENEVGPYKNIERIRALYRHCGKKIINRWISYGIKKDQSFFPVFRYMDWNVSMADLETHANEILKTEIDEFLLGAQKKASQAANQAQEVVNKKLKTISDIVTADIPGIESLEANVHFETKSKLTDFLVRKQHSQEPIHIDNQGDGVRRQIWFGLMRWKANATSQEVHQAKQFIWCFDEPETHLYPKAQREFFGLIRRVAQQNIQVLLSTHSSIFVDRAKMDSIHQVSLQNGITTLSKCTEVEDVYDALKIRNSDFLFYDRFLMVEGDTEAVLIPHLYKLYTGQTLFDDGIQLVKLGGSGKRVQNMRILENLLADYQKVEHRTVFLLDQDVQLARQDFPEGRTFFVGKQDIEDSICSGVWSQFFTSYLPDGLSLTVEEVDRIKRNVPADRSVSAQEKFFPILQKAVNEKISEAGFSEEEKNHAFQGLPKDKGTEISTQLCAYITRMEQVGPNIKAAFDHLKQ